MNYGSSHRAGEYQRIPIDDPSSPSHVQRAAAVNLPAAVRRIAVTRGGGGSCFMLVVACIIIGLYSAYAVVILKPLVMEWLTKFIPTGIDDLWSRSLGDELQPDRLQAHLGMLVVLSFHMWFFLCLFSLIQASLTDPGTVPSHWGKYVGEESKRRRYCRICNVWKPERTHHCSTCGRCVLNMDHHCPWINNCVGFFNRKFFIQTLCNANISLLYVCIHGLYYLASTASSFWVNDFRPTQPGRSPMEYLSYTVVLLATLAAAILLGALFPFINFHMRLVIHNSTTIESMDPNFRDQMKFDLGSERNLEQVFGPNKLLWWLPMHTPASRPVGDGVRWRRHYLRSINEDDV